MPEQTPDYVPRPSGSSAGVVIGIVAAVLLLLVVCGVGLLGVGWLAYRTVEVQVPVPPAQVLRVDEVPTESPKPEPPNAIEPTSEEQPIQPDAVPQRPQ
jgi:hypothetical protein